MMHGSGGFFDSVLGDVEDDSVYHKPANCSVWRRVKMAKNNRGGVSKRM